MVCHMHQPNMFVNSYLRHDHVGLRVRRAAHVAGEAEVPDRRRERAKILDRNPEEAAIRGKWSDPEFLKNVSSLNPKLKDTQFADYHGHGWNFRAVFKRDRKGTLLDKDGKPVVGRRTRRSSRRPCTSSSIHLDVGMHCVDCHFAQDMHGNGHIYGEVAAAIEIDCRDCHGTADRLPDASHLRARRRARAARTCRCCARRTAASASSGATASSSSARRVDPDLEWEMSLVKDTVTPGNAHYNEKAARAKLMHAGRRRAPGAVGPGRQGLAHADEKMTCFTCHLSWTTSCGGCHLPIQANWKTERHHYEGGETRNYATYNPQVARDEMFQLGRHGPVKGGRIAPVRSSSALVLSSTNINRERIYIQQPPIAASGFTSQAFAPHYPHTERKTETKTCTDCHVSDKGDNNAIMAQLLLHGTNFVNFVGFNAWVGEERHVEAVQVTEWDEPQAVIGSYLHRYAYPDWYADHEKRGRRLAEAHDHTAARPGGLRAAARRVPLRRRGRGRPARLRRRRRSPTRASRSASSRRRSRRSATTRTWRPRNATCVALPTNQPIAPRAQQGRPDARRPTRSSRSTRSTTTRSSPTPRRG